MTREGPFAAAETLVRPADETLRHENRIEPVRQPDDPPPEVFRTPAARNLHAERHPAEQPFGNLGKALRAGESEIIEVQVVARNDNGYFAVALREAPRVGFDVEKSVGNRLEEQVGRKPDAARADRTLHPVVGRREDTDLPHEGLRAQLLQLFGSEVAVSDPDGLQGPDPFREHQIVAFSERIRPFEDRQHVAVGLQGGQHDGHSHQSGQGEPEGLRHAQVAAQEFPEQRHRAKILS